MLVGWSEPHRPWTRPRRRWSGPPIAAARAGGGGDRGRQAVQGFVLDIMVAEGYITQAQADEAAAEEIVLACAARQPYRAPHFVYAVRREAARLLGDENLLDRGGLRIDTTLQYDGYQRSAEKWARVAYDLDRLTDERLVARYGEEALGWIKQLQGRNINNDALVTLDYRTGAVIAYVGSANYYGRATWPSRSSTWWARPTASPARPSSRSPTPPASSAGPRPPP